MKDSSTPKDSSTAAVEAYRRGYTPIPIRNNEKKPYGAAWPHTRYDTEDQVKASFDAWAKTGASNIGLLLGAPSGGLIDIDIDHPKALRLRDIVLERTAMRTGHAGRPLSHFWYRVTEDLPGTRRYKMPDGSVSVELRSDGAQTVIPPSVHPSGEIYRWEGDPWGGAQGPLHINGKKLAIQVALLGLASVLLDNWPRKGGRHDAYLALAGGLLKWGDDVHPWWEKNLPVLIDSISIATRDPEPRVAEVVDSTITRLREGGEAVGFPTLAGIIGNDHAEMARRLAKDVEALSGFTGTPMRRLTDPTVVELSDEDSIVSTLPPEVRNPMEERLSSWAAVDLEPYLTGQVTLPEPSILSRDDGQGLMYPGRVNSLYGKSEAAKSWMAIWACIQEMAKGERVIYIDFEDLPEGTIGRLKALGAGDDDIQQQFRYVHPEGPLADMQRYRFGYAPTDDGVESSSVFKALVDTFDPTLIVADGNEATATEVITGWLKRMCRGGRTTVIVIDHTGKGDTAGASPIGAHHKVAMVQGTALRVDVIDRPMPDAKGLVRLIVFKDRPGAVRKISSNHTEQIAGDVTIDSRQPGITRISITASDPAEVVVANTDSMEAKLATLDESAEIQTAILALFEGDLDRTLTTPQVTAALDISSEQAYAAWEQLRLKGAVVTHGKTRWQYHQLKVPPTT
jgi:hypothetical protein